MSNKLFAYSIILNIIIGCGPTGAGEGFSKNNMTFAKSLSAYKLFKGAMANLTPNDNIQVLELSSALFTDYAEKQRLLKLPPGTKMTSKGDGLPDFPEGTILAKTFYYNASQTQDKRHIIETRILIKHKSKWNVATYQWNDAQTDALLKNDGDIVPVTIITPNGKTKNLKYKIPDVYQCYECHKSNHEIIPIGPKIRNLNVNIFSDNKMISQLEQLSQKGLLDIKNPEAISVLPAYKDPQLPLEKRARAYFELNCAHCHSPEGFAGSYSLNLKYETTFKNTGILFNKWNIEHRMTIRDMPKLGTTIIDEEGLKLIQQYLATLKK